MNIPLHFHNSLHWTEECNNSNFYHRPTKITLIKEKLHHIFHIGPLMAILRDYILGGIVTPLDIFEELPFPSEDLYRLLSFLSGNNCPLSFSDSPSMRTMRNRIFSEVVDESGSPFQPSMLGENACISIYRKYVHNGIEVPGLDMKSKELQDVLKGKKIKRILIEKYGIRKRVALHMVLV